MRKLITVTAAFLFLAAGESVAIVEPGDGLLWFNVGYSAGTTAEQAKDVDGAVAGIGFEKLDWDKPLSFGVGIAYSEISDERTEGNRTINTTVATVPINLGAKYWLGRGKVQGYLGAYLGLYYSEIRRTVIETDSEFTSLGYTGGGMSFPLGGALSLGETLLLNASYTLNWMWSNEAFDSDLLHAVMVGLGINLGD